MTINKECKGKKYEYLEVLYMSYFKCRPIIGGAPTPKEMEYTINQLGLNGFELVAVFSTGDKWPHAIFKREIIDEEKFMQKK